MTVELLESLPPLNPLDFFVSQGTLSKAPRAESKPSSEWMHKKAALPLLSVWLEQEVFAKLALCWHDRGLFVDLIVDQPFAQMSYPKYQEGDALELFIDTRDLKQSRFATEFCHHFLILPQPVEGVLAQELSLPRQSESHPLCAAGQEVGVEVLFKENSYQMRIDLPAHCLHGFDPLSCPRLGFGYRLHRFKGPPQLFFMGSSYFSLEQHPHFWASFSLKH